MIGCYGDFVLLLLINVLPTKETNSCSKPLGMMSGQIRDWQISASSALPFDPGCQMKFARLHQPKDNAWCPKNKAASEWLLIDLGVTSQVTGVITQGRGEESEWVTSFTLSFSVDAFKWDFAKDIYGKKKVFHGNVDSYSLRHNYLEDPVPARFIRIHVLTWNNHPSLRVEIVGCQDCNEVLSLPPYTKVSASSHPPWTRQNSCQPDEAFIYSNRAWCARHSNGHQWLQFDIGPPSVISGIVTKGRGDTGRRQWVTSYTISFSNDSYIWYFYKDGNHLDPKLFGGNMDKNTERQHYLNYPLVARFVRIHPVSWYHGIALRAALLGCPHKGECGAGFLKVNSLANCVEDLAYNRDTWVNDKRHHWKEWKYGHSALAVNGQTSTVLPDCSIMDNYYVDYPVWMVDLGRKQDIGGVIVVTWQGEGQDKVTLYSDYVLNLDKLTVYVANKPRLEAVQLQNESKCDTVSRLNSALFKPTIHFECHEPLRGRYVYIRATGVPNRWNRLFSTVLCQVLVYQ